MSKILGGRGIINHANHAGIEATRRGTKPAWTGVIFWKFSRHDWGIPNVYNPQIGDRGKLFGDVIDIRHCSGNPLAKYIIRGPITCLLSCGLWAKVPQTVVYPCKTNAISNPFTQYIILGGMINQEPRKWKSCVGLPKIGFHDDFLLAALVASERTSICSNLGENSNRQR